MNISSLLDIVSGKRKGLLPDVVRIGLGSLTPIYRAVVNRRNSQFDSNEKLTHAVSVPVISIGNITTGGTGKTPMVAWICRLLLKNSIQPGIVSRGYGSRSNERSETQKNDEALELENRLPGVPHVQNRDRVLAATQCIDSHGVSAVVLDDGFQHRRLGRDIDIVLIDASNPFGYGRLLPRGLLREPLSSLKRADAIVITRSESVTPDKVNQIRQRIEAETAAPIAVAQTQTNSISQFEGNPCSFDSLRSKKWFAFSAIGNPEAFENSLGSAGLDVRGSTRFRDHHWYTTQEQNVIADLARRCGADHLICTHKDLVKIGTNDIKGIPLFALMIDVNIVEGREALEHLVLSAAKV